MPLTTEQFKEFIGNIFIEERRKAFDDTKTINKIKQLIGPKYYGELTFKFENGKIVLIRKSETIKPKGAT